MTSDNVQIVRHTDLRQKEIIKPIHKNDLYNQKGKLFLNHSPSDVKSSRRFSPVKKNYELSKTIVDSNICDVILNSQYFKLRSGSSSFLSFCSGDKGEHKWTVNSRQSTHKGYSNSDEMDKSNSTGHVEKERKSIRSPSKTKERDAFIDPNCPEKAGDAVEGKIHQDLITLITEQMFLAERELQITRTHLMETISKLNERDLEIIKLHEKIRNLQKSNIRGKDESECSSKTSADYQKLASASEKLKRQVKDMEDFLNDYGLVWVGDKECSCKPDFDKIIKNFQRLNSVASQPKIIQTTLGAKFELSREISLVIYSNGILLRGNDFREYSKLSTNLFLQDVEDGYFPSELQPEYPEGVPFEVVDRRNEAYSKTSVTPTFQGIGNRLGSTFEDKPASVVFLEPIQDPKIFQGQSSEGWTCKKTIKKRGRNPYLQEDGKNHITNLWKVSEVADDGKHNVHDSGKPLTLKIRFGKEKTQYFFLRVHENDKMVKFQDRLQQELCQRFHDEYLVDGESGSPPTDFEIHIYGRNPYRLNDNLHRRIKDCGIVDKCVINLNEI